MAQHGYRHISTFYLHDDLMARLKNWLHWGCDAAVTHALKRKILHANITAFLTMVTMLIVAAINVMIGNPALIESSVVAVLF